MLELTSSHCLEAEETGNWKIEMLKLSHKERNHLSIIPNPSQIKLDGKFYV